MRLGSSFHGVGEETVRHRILLFTTLPLKFKVP